MSLRVKGHALSMQWSGEYGIESSSTGTCKCGKWEESASSQTEVRFEYSQHLLKVKDQPMPEHRPDEHWAACSITEFGHVGEKRHIIRKGALTTLCSHSASYPGIWRHNTTKPKCEECIKINEKRRS